MTGSATPTIIPRWEWRVFARDLGEPGERIAALAPDDVVESDEVYLLSPEGEDTVKIRGGLMDVKHLEEVDHRGLERWRPVLKSSFPIDGTVVRRAWEALALPAPSLARDAYTLDELTGELCEQAGVRVIPVHKHRRRYRIGGCAVELTDVRTPQGEVRTIAVESEDADRVIDVVRELGLGGQPNTSYPRAPRRYAGDVARRAAVIDVGTNSVKVCVGALAADGGWRVIADRAVVTRLGEGLAEGGALAAAPMARTIDAICDMAGEARRAGALDIAVVGTAGLRMASNRDAFADDVRARCHLEVEVISGEEESRLGYLAARSAAGPVDGQVVVFEVGGGSSQFTFGRGDRVDERFSLDVGAVRITERYGLDGAVSRAALDEARAGIAAELGRLRGRARPDALIGMGGALTNLAAVHHGLAVYAPEVVEGTLLGRAEIDAQIDRYSVATAEERSRIVGLQPARAPVILGGACIVRTVLEMLGSASVTVTDRGLRHAVLEGRSARSP